MISTNALFLSDLLPSRQPAFYAEFLKLLDKLNIKYSILPGTKDIWCRDFMPVQLAKNKFIQFKYLPDYLNTPKWRKTISDTSLLCKRIGIKPKVSDIKIDGGNVVRSKTKAIMTDKIFKENHGWDREKLKQKLKSLLQVKELIIIPKQPYDKFGHSDGMIRFIDENTVLVNDFSGESKSFQKAFYKKLSEAGLNTIELPYTANKNKYTLDATGTYINYLQIGKTIIMPRFGLKKDALAFKTLKTVFKGYKIAGINCRSIAKEGGVLNCINWEIAN